ncbi:hypothetical protein IM697_04235 [Streptomyces ferrugineus]|uniref:Uncharacterized protein n=1 Tax=Streptomyces ferrugineus TaxID=1413221 RepID=A0A7M2SMR8_9ACTN|nr:hypothetical protein [Streptomyces ferrugineus]QOV37646.1 hypothetical protein IM697_04235 [Streptomyces ferrugineus]
MSRYGTTRSSYGREAHPGAIVRPEPLTDTWRTSREIEAELNPEDAEQHDEDGGWITP